jgi:hypothetical protein
VREAEMWIVLLSKGFSALRKLISMIQEMLDTGIGRVCMEKRRK